MKFGRILLTTAALFAISLPAWAEYTIFLKNGTIYKAEEKWKIVNGQAQITLTSGSVLSFDPGLIDVERTQQANELGLGDARLITTERQTQTSSSQTSTLGERVRLRRRTTEDQNGDAEQTQAAASTIDRRAIVTLERAYENVGIFGASINPGPGATIQAQVTANNEDDVMKALSATSFVMSRMDQIETVQLLMATLTGGSAGRFEMSRQDAQALVDKHMSWQSYYIQNVIF